MAQEAKKLSDSYKWSAIQRISHEGVLAESVKRKIEQELDSAYAESVNRHEELVRVLELYDEALIIKQASSKQSQEYNDVMNQFERARQAILDKLK